ncbi:unnamed protein product [Durusdinium trenchii]|uniref:Carrier domain-containing protein n=2 Tax=Durusdinium trenchii TaxID=1381693 RepID=A0ABP0H4P8_9DINO
MLGGSNSRSSSSSPSSPLLRTESTATEADIVEHWVGKLEGCPPLLAQLPTDQLGPAEQHREAELVSVTSWLKGTALPHDNTAEATARLICGLATLMGRYSLATELGLGLWRSDLSSPGCQPMRVSLLRQPGDATPVLGSRVAEEESSVVAPLSSYSSAECFIQRIQKEVLLFKDSRLLLCESGLRELDKHSQREAPPSASLQRSQVLEIFLVLGSEAEPPVSCPQAAITLACPRWPPRSNHETKLEMRCQRGHFSPETISRMLRHLTTFMNSQTWGPQLALCQHSLQKDGSEDEQEVSGFADAFSSSCYMPGAKDYFNPDRSISSMIEAVAKAFPNELALLDDSSGATYSYQELLKMSSSLAFALRLAGVFPDNLVPLMAARGVEMILGILGILRTGSGYVPLDLHWPEDRLEDVLRQCSSKVVLASSDCHSKLSAIAWRVSSVTSVLDVRTRVEGPGVADEGQGSTLAYTFFTSGTTGKPKGVMVENKGLVHRVHWFQQRWPLYPGEGIVSKVAYTFGLSEWEIFWPLTAGAALILAPPGGEKDAEYLLRRACHAFHPPSRQERLIPGKGPSPDHVNCVSAHIFVPSMLQMIFDKYDELEEEDMQRKAGEHHVDGTWWHHSKARDIVTCGEALNPSLTQKMFSCFHHCTLTNLYGPTEGEMTYWEVPQGRAVLRVSAGAPMEGCKVVLADLRDSKSAAMLEPAEIAFGGPFIARGYLGRPDLDKKAFVPDFTTIRSDSSLESGDSSTLAGSSPCESTPLSNESAEAASMMRRRGAGTLTSWANSEDGSSPRKKTLMDRLYMTGDLGRWREGGVIDLLGRKDFQVKLRGFRIELGEIEAACRAAGARAAVCVLHKNGNGMDGLVAYFEPGSDEVREASVRASCQKSLPSYMQPQVIVRLEQLPRNTNGKIDRAKLPEPLMPTTPSTTCSPPETSVQKMLVNIISELLGLPVGAIGLDADFQELGGNSLLMGRASSAIKKAFRLSNFKGTAMYQLGTVRRIAASIESMLHSSSESMDEKTLSNRLATAQQPRQSTCSSMSFGSICAQTFGVFWLSFLLQRQAWSPAWWAAWYIWWYFGEKAFFLYLPCAAFLDLLVMLMVAVLMKWIVLGRVKPGKIELWSFDYYKWWFVNNLLKATIEHMMPIIGETPLANCFLRLLGANIGPGARISPCTIHDPDLIEVGANATIGKRVKLATSSVLHGQVHLDYIRIGNAAAVGPTAVLSQNTCVPDQKAVLPLSTMPGWHGPIGSVAFCNAQPPIGDETFQHRQSLLRVLFGMPAVLILEVLPLYPTYFILAWTYYRFEEYSPEYGYYLWCVCLAWIFMHPINFFRAVVIVLQKWILIGDFRKQKKDQISHWNEWKTWVHGRASENHDFEELCQFFTNTEFLSWLYRALGTKIGHRVQIDQLDMVEHDCIHVDDYVVFGIKVLLASDVNAPWVPLEYSRKMEQQRGPKQRYADIRICRGANVLDHCTLLPGVTVAERAVLGTYTLATAGSYYPPLAIHSGNQRGRSMHLRDYLASPSMRELEDKTMQDLDSPITWWRFNLVILLVILFASPLPTAAWVVTYFGVTTLWDFESEGILTGLLVTPFVFNSIELFLLLLNILLKWIVIGRYKAGEYKFFGSYHTCWMCISICGRGISALHDSFRGSVFEVLLARALGAKVGKECYLSGLMVEYDLLTIGDHVAIGCGCDTTGHTVENMVIKLAPTRIADGAALLPGSFAMPGSEIEDEAVLMEHTQVLKGETVPSREVWAGMPASSCRPVPK